MDSIILTSLTLGCNANEVFLAVNCECGFHSVLGTTLLPDTT